METSVNNKCKAFTSLEQSKKLAEILPLESANMYYSDIPVREWIDKTDISKGTHIVFKSRIFAIENLRSHEIEEGDIYAWSLSALLGVLPKIINNETLFIETSAALWHIGYRDTYTARADNPVDACCELILKLHELNLL